VGLFIRSRAVLLGRRRRSGSTAPGRVASPSGLGVLRLAILVGMVTVGFSLLRRRCREAAQVRGALRRNVACSCTSPAPPRSCKAAKSQMQAAKRRGRLKFPSKFDGVQFSQTQTCAGKCGDPFSPPCISLCRLSLDALRTPPLHLLRCWASAFRGCRAASIKNRPSRLADRIRDSPPGSSLR
jgi:hypothetical protein